MARTAPAAARGDRPVTTYREDLITVALTIWPIMAMFFDGRNHNNKTGQESFWSLAAPVPVRGMTVVGVVDHVLVTRYQLAAGVDPEALMPDLKAIPVGYGVAILGLSCSPSPARPTSSGTLYGFEVGVDAIYSPPHLALFFGGLLVASTGIRSMWAKQDIVLDLKGSAPVPDLDDPVHRRRRVHHDVPVGVHDQRHADERLRARLRVAVQRPVQRPDDQPQRRADRLRRRPVVVLLLRRLARDRVEIVTTLVLLGPACCCCAAGGCRWAR